MSKQVTSSLIGCSLWAGAVAVANACRISEVLSITNFQVQPNGMAWTVGSKGSNSRLIYLGLLSSEAEELRSVNVAFKLFPWGYQHVYRACLAYGFAGSLPCHKHRVITHAGRYRLAQEIAQASREAVAGEVLGHKSKTAIEYYIKPQNCKQKVSDKQAKRKSQTLEEFLYLLP